MGDNERLTPAHLKYFRETFNLSQQDAADQIGVTRVTWNRWENKKTTIPLHLTNTLRGAVQELKRKVAEQEK